MAKVVFCVPSLNGPTPPFIAAMEQAIAPVIAAGWTEGLVEERGNPYISSARALMLRRALDAKADVIVFLDYDISFPPETLLQLIETPGDVVAGTYRYKCDDERYMGELEPGPVARADGCVKAAMIPAGFLKITSDAVHKLIGAYPELCYGARYAPHFDLFNHGAFEGVWWGEDYAFSRRWRAMGGDIWLDPRWRIDHHKCVDGEWQAYAGDYHDYLQRQPGGRKWKGEA